MFFYMPTKVYEEENCIEKHGDEICELGRRALIVTGKHSSKKNGSLSDMENVLRMGKVEYVVFDDIEENPSVETVIAAAKMGKRAKADFVIGIGGGSPLDAAKAVALLLGAMQADMACGSEADIACDSEATVWSEEACTELLYDVKAQVNPVPVVAVPTTCGTGSEVTGVSVLTVHARRTKVSLPYRIFPKLALVDAKYLSYADRQVICNTAIDAMSHLVESYLVKVASPYSNMLVREGLETWARTVDALWGKREFTGNDYRNLMHAATLGGMSIAHTGTAIPHTMSYTVTYDLHVPHGVAVGYFLPGYLKLAGKKGEELLEMMGMDSLETFAGFFQDITKVGTLPQEKLTDIVETVSRNQAKLALCCYDLNRDKLALIAGWKYDK